MLTQYIIEAFLLGLSMGGYCTASCTPFLLPYILANQNDKFISRMLAFGQFLLGRLAAYILFAVIVSLIAISSEDLITSKVKSILLIIASLLMILFAVFSSQVKFCQLSRFGKLSGSFPLLTGFIIGLNLCPPFIVAMVNVIKLDSVLYSCVYFIFLFLGTSVYLIPVAFVSALLKSEFFKRVGTYLGVLIGIWFLIQGISGLL